MSTSCPSLTNPFPSRLYVSSRARRSESAGELSNSRGGTGSEGKSQQANYLTPGVVQEVRPSHDEG